MKLKYAASLATAAGLLCALAASTPATVMAESGDLGPMRFMLGTWVCAGQAMDGTPFRITEITALSSDGTRLITHDSQGKTTTELWYDAGRKAWMETSVDSGSGSNSSESSPGWTGDTLVFTGTFTLAGTPAVGYRSTTVKLGPTRTKNQDEIQRPDGPWIQFDSATCEKSK